MIKINGGILKNNKRIKDGKKALDTRVLFIMDDCMSAKKQWAEDPNFLSIMNEGRHRHINYILSMQYSLGILPEYQNKGFGVEALELIVDYVFTYLNVHQLFANIASKNLKSISLFEKFNFKQVGIKKDLEKGLAELMVGFIKKYEPRAVFVKPLNKNNTYFRRS